MRAKVPETAHKGPSGAPARCPDRSESASIYLNPRRRVLQARRPFRSCAGSGEARPGPSLKLAIDPEASV